MKACLVRHGETTWSLSGQHTGLTDLAEWDYGDFEGRRSVGIRQDYSGWNIWRDGCPSGDSTADIVVRADRLIARLATMEGVVSLNECPKRPSPKAMALSG